VRQARAAARQCYRLTLFASLAFALATACATGSHTPELGAKAPPGATEDNGVDESRLDHYLDRLRENADWIGVTLDPSSAALEAETHRYLFQAITMSYPRAFHGDAQFPDWMPSLSNVYAHAAANPDTTYLYTEIDGKGTYRISGTRGTTRFVDIQAGANLQGGGHTTLDLDDFTIAEDGSFSFVWSADRPEGYDGDLALLPREAAYVFLRQVAYDWVNEIDARVAIERLDGPTTRPRMTPEEIDERLLRMTERVAGAKLFPTWLADKKERGIVNRLELNTYGAMGGVKGQAYYEGLFELGEDEALLVEVPIPSDCGYWSAQLFDDLFVSIDYVHRQSSLNGHTAWVGDSGGAQVIVSARDPGVQNWLDVSGYARGGFMWRWLRCPRESAPKVTKVPFAALPDLLAEKTPGFSAADRAEQMSRRRVGAQLRRRW
jgi:hypothetical protein